MNKKENNLLLSVLLVSAIIILILFVMLFILLIRKEREQEEKQTQNDIYEELPQDFLPEEDTDQTEEESEEQQVVYPAPDYEFDTASDTVHVKIPGLSRNYRIAWVSDLHLITDLEPAEDVFEEYVNTLRDRHDLMFVTDDGVHSEELWPEIIKYLNYNNFDAVILGGDIMDYCSRSNLDTFMEGYNSLKYARDRIMYIRADHDYGSWYGGDVQTEWRAHELHAMEIDGKETYDPLEDYYRFLDLGEFAIVGINESTKNMTGDQLEVITNKFEENKPIIIATHVPYEPWRENDKAQLADLSMQVRGKIYYWSADSEHYIPVERTLDYFNLLRGEDTLAKQVLAGHLHHEWDGMLTDVLPEHIFTPAYQGAIGIIEVTP